MLLRTLKIWSWLALQGSVLFSGESPECYSQELDVSQSRVLRFVRADPSENQGCGPGTRYENASSSCTYHLAFLFPFLNFPGKAVRVLGAYLALHHVNTRNTTFVPEASELDDGFRCSATLFDTDFSPEGGITAALEAKETSAVAIIGAARSSATIPVAHVSLTGNITVVSYASTSASLSSSTTFPLFSRTIPTDSETSKSIAKLMLREFGWRRVAMLFVDDSYGNSYYQDFLTACQEVSESLNLTVQDTDISGAALSSGLVESSLQRLKNLGYRVFALVLLDQTIAQFLRAAIFLNMIGEGYTYITVDSDISEVLRSPIEHGATLDEVPMFRDALQGFLRVFPDPIVEPKYSALHQEVQRIGADIVPDEYKEAIKAQGDGEPHLAEWFAKGLQQDIFAIYAYDAVWAVALALARAEREDSEWLSSPCEGDSRCRGGRLTELIRLGQFSGASGVVSFSYETSAGGAKHFSGDRDSEQMQTRVQFYNSTSSSWVTAGFLLGDGLRIDTPIAWPGPRSRLPPDGRDCTPGERFNGVTLECEQCRPGTFSTGEGSAVCMPCPVGEYCASEGCKACRLCPKGTYQNQTGGTECSVCPMNTDTGTDQGSTSIEACACVWGFYRRDGMPGAECFPCPEGGVCDGGPHAPYPMEGYWGDWSAVDKRAPDSAAAAQSIHRTAFHRCTIEEYCRSNIDADTAKQLVLGREGADAALLGSEQLQQEAMRLVRSNSSSLCVGQAEGTLCANCAEGYFHLGGRCTKCLQPEALFVIGCILAIIFAWYLMNRIAASRYEAVDLTLIFFQNASTIGSFSLNWSEWLKSGPFFFLAIVNFDVDYFNPDCLSTDGYQAWTYGHSLVLQLLLPVLVSGASVACYFLGKAVVTYRERREGHSHAHAANADESGGSGKPRQGGAVWAAVGWLGIPVTRAALETQLDSVWETSTSFVNVIYHTLALKSLEIFFCKSFPDGSSYLVAAPYVPCWERAHYGYIAIGSVGLVVYTLGVPLALYLLLEYARAHDLFNDVRFSARFGWLYRRYSKDWYNWELVLMARRALLILALVVAKELPSIQTFMGTQIVVLAVAAHCYALPFIANKLNQLEIVSLVCLLGVLGTGTLFSDAVSAEKYPGWEDTVTGVTCGFLFGAVVFVADIVRHNIKTEEAASNVARRARQAVISILETHVPETVHESPKDCTTSLHAMRFVTKFLKLPRTSADGGSQTGKAKAEKAYRRLEKLQTSRASPRAETGSWCENSAADSEDEELLRWGRVVDRLREDPLELNKTLDAVKLLKWMSPSKAVLRRTNSFIRRSPRVSPEESGEGSQSAFQLPPEIRLGVVRFWLVNHWMKEMLSDTSAVSFYSRSAYSRFFGSLVSENPYLIDHFLNSNRQRLHRAKECLNDLRVSRMVYGRQGRLAKMLTDIDRGAFLAWMMIAPWDKIQVVRHLLEGIQRSAEQREQSSSSKVKNLISRGSRGKENSPGRQDGNDSHVLDRFIKSLLPQPERMGFTTHRATATGSSTLKTKCGDDKGVGQRKTQVASGNAWPQRQVEIQNMSDDLKRSAMRASSLLLLQTSDELQQLDTEVGKGLDFTSEVPTYLAELEEDLQQDLQPCSEF